MSNRTLNIANVECVLVRECDARTQTHPHTETQNHINLILIWSTLNKNWFSSLPSQQIEKAFLFNFQFDHKKIYRFENWQCKSTRICGTNSKHQNREAESFYHTLNICLLFSFKCNCFRLIVKDLISERLQ